MDTIYIAHGTLEDIEKQVIVSRFQRLSKNKTQCSISLGISIRTLEAKLEKYGADEAATRKRESDEQQRRKEIEDRMYGRNVPTPPPHPDNVRRAKERVEAEQRAASDEAERESLLGPGAGVHVESSSEAFEEQALPVQKRSEVQGVLPSKASKGSNRKSG